MKKVFKLPVLSFFAVCMVTLYGCKKDTESLTNSVPTLATTEISGITVSSVVAGGYILYDGGAEVIARGVCWSRSKLPTTSSDKTSDGTGTGSFTAIINGLTANTSYYVRAYAINSEGTSYGNQLEFTTAEQSAGILKAVFSGGGRFGAVSFAIGTKLYLGLGDNSSNFRVRDFWEWDQATNIWKRLADYPGNSLIGDVGFSIGTKGYIGTGYNINNEGVMNDFWEYDPSTNIWTEKASLPVSAARAAATGFSIGTKGYIGLGSNGNLLLKDFWEWDQTTNIWKLMADFEGTLRVNAVGFSIGNKGYIGTGMGTGFGNEYAIKDFWEWDQATNKWTKKADFGGSARYLAVGFSIGDKGYIGTGSDASTLYKDFWEWDQATNIWTRKADFGGSFRYGAVGLAISDRGYIGTGIVSGFINGTDWEEVLNDFWEYDPK